MTLPRLTIRFFVFELRQEKVEGESQVLVERTVLSILRQEMVVDSSWLLGEVGSSILQLAGRPQRSLVEVLYAHSRST
jgi:hypothetical protein